MRDENRIEPLMAEIAVLWRKNQPDMRFGQFISNVLGEVYDRSGKRDPFFIEDEEMLKLIKEIPWLSK